MLNLINLEFYQSFYGNQEEALKGNPIRIKLPVSIEGYLEIIEEFGVGHHWIIAYGHLEKELRRLASLLKIDFIQI